MNFFYRYRVHLCIVAIAITAVLVSALSSCSFSGGGTDTAGDTTAAEPVITFDFELKNDGTYMITDYHCDRNAYKITIPAEHEGKPVTEIGSAAFMNEYFGEITIPASVKKIGENAFDGVRLYTKDSSSDFRVYYDGTLEEWMQIEFYNNSNPMSVSSWNYDACSHFYLRSGDDYRELTELNIPQGFSSIGEYQFVSFNAVTKIVIPEGVEEVGGYAFRFCTSVEELSLPASLETMGMYSFSQFGVQDFSFTVPATVRYIEPFAFNLSRFSELIFEDPGDGWAAFSFIGCPSDWKTVELDSYQYSYFFDSPEDNISDLVYGTTGEYYLRRCD